MKKIIAVSAGLLLLIFLLPLTMKDKTVPEDKPAEQAESEKSLTKPETSDPGLIYIPEEPEESRGADGQVCVNALVGGSVQTMTMHDYLCGVVAAEMPAAFEPEALKAQAVAARTYTLYRMHEERAAAHPDADVCDDVGCCKAYLPEETLKTRWGADFEQYMGVIEAAVSETDGLCMTYEGKAIFAAFHSSSDGYTESAGNVFRHELPYLQSVFSPENAETVPNYTTTVSVSFADFRAAVFGSFPAAVFGVDPSGWITDVQRSLGGRIVSLRVGGAELSGTQFRFLFSLRSSSIEIGQTAEGFTFSVTGYGHGVGMSQYGANRLAAGGSGFEEILNWYYTGVELSNMLEIYALAPKN